MRSTGRILFWGLIVICLRPQPCLGTAITGAVEGTIKDKATGQTVPGVKITLVSAKNETLTFELASDQRGHFYRSGLIPGIYEITLEKEGYFPQGGSIRIVLDETTRLELRLEPAKGQEAGTPAVAKTVVAGNELVAAGKFEEAIARLSEIILQFPFNPVPHYYRGQAYERSGRSEEALQNYQKAVELKADFILPLTRSGMIWAKKGDFEKAADFYGKALDRGDQDPTTQYNFGACLTNLGRSFDARAVYEKLLARDPEYSDAYYQLAILCLSAGETAKAKELLEKFIVKDPENKNAALAKEILKSLSRQPGTAC